MGQRYNDEEDLLDAFVNILKAKFNEELERIDTSKSEILNIPKIDTDQYFDTLNLNACKVSFMFYGVEETTPIQAGNDVAKSATFAFMACYNSVNDLKLSRTMLRVQKALENVLKDSWRKEISNNFEITRTDPLLMKDDSGDFTVAAGVMVEAQI
jgi:hypothetical protein